MKLELLNSLRKGDDILQKDRLVNGIIERLTNNFELKPSEVYVLLDYVKQLQKENKELSHIVANKVISDYDIDTPLKKELGEARLKIVSLEDVLSEYKKEKEDLIKCLENMIDWTSKKSNIGEKMKKDYTEQQKICWWINHARMDILDRIKDSNYD